MKNIIAAVVLTAIATFWVCGAAHAEPPADFISRDCGQIGWVVYD